MTKATRRTHAQAAAEILRELNAERAAAGVCRHCGGRLPCWSEFGDRSPGKRHTRRSFDAMRKAER